MPALAQPAEGADHRYLVRILNARKALVVGLGDIRDAIQVLLFVRALLVGQDLVSCLAIARGYALVS
ncbi:hypothetical protein [Pseudomonas sp. SBB6]|uniref:hypothetical protein n=1 Tax=Pseudomonas sp. SBB6 TaxID=2962032 RepID=UPI0020B7C0A9|nr:hypothetical protein [Pseudomonas sp. SBB6]MCP3751452.1 hypothetical protein [Pseudomonas sp. SBB6]